MEGVSRSAVPGGSGGSRQAERSEGGGQAPPKKRGRRPGKHSSGNYTQTSIYLPIQLRNQVRARLYERGMEMSGLVEDMLRDWLRRESAVEVQDPKS